MSPLSLLKLHSVYPGPTSASVAQWVTRRPHKPKIAGSRVVGGLSYVVFFKLLDNLYLLTILKFLQIANGKNIAFSISSRSLENLKIALKSSMFPETCTQTFQYTVDY